MKSAETIWTRMQARLDTSVPDWKARIDGYGQVQAAQERARGRAWTNDEIFRGLLLALLSSNVDWDKIERIKAELGPVFFGFSMSEYARMDPGQVDERIVPWFLARKSGGLNLRAGLRNLIESASRLVERARGFGGCVHAFLESVHEQLGHDPKRLALELAMPGSASKLPGFGVPLAAEALRNLGYDLAKPDRHVNRASGCFGWVEFRKWPDRSKRTVPQNPTPGELLAVMTAVEAAAREVGELVSRFDNALWILCAKGGAWLTNEELFDLARS